jgi:hypothetical protein
MRALVTILAVLLGGCYLATEAEGDAPLSEEVCDGVDNDGDGCVDVTSDPSGVDGSELVLFMVIEVCSEGGISVCVDGEMTTCSEEVEITGIRGTCDSGFYRIR